MQDDKKQRVRKSIDKETDERIKHLLSNDLLFSHMPPMERIQPKPPKYPVPACAYWYLHVNTAWLSTNNQPTCLSQDLRTTRKKRWKGSDEILALPTHMGQKDQTDNSQSLDYKAIEKKNRWDCYTNFTNVKLYILVPEEVSLCLGKRITCFAHGLSRAIFVTYPKVLHRNAIFVYWF